MSSARVIFAVIMLMNGVIADGPHDRCCSEKNLLVDGCMVTDIAYNGGDRVIVWRSDGMVFDVAFSKVNLVPRFSAATDQSSNDTIRFMVNMKGLKVVERKRSYPNSDNEVTIDGETADGCDLDSVPAVIHKLLALSCSDYHDDKSLFLHHVGTFFAKGKTKLIHVGYYRRQEPDSDSHGVDTKVMAWDGDGKLLYEGWYKDYSATVTVAGLWGKDGKQLVLSVNSYGHMCFHYRSYDSLDFGIPGVAGKFMPECIPANMLFGCPQSFCFTGHVDEIIESYKIDIVVRGMFMHPVNRSTIKNGLRLDTTSAVSWNVDGNLMPMNCTITAAFFVSVPTHSEYTHIAEFVAIVMDELTEGDDCYRTALALDSGWSLFMNRSFFRSDFIPREDKILGMFYERESSILQYITESEFITVPVHIIDHLDRENKSSYALQGTGIGTRFKKLVKNVDAIFQFNGTKYHKAGQFFWKELAISNASARIPTIRHGVYNPNGIIDITHCGWTDAEVKELITKINASAINHSNLMPVNESVHAEKTISMMRKQILIMILLWVISFFPTLTFIMVFKKIKSEKKSLRSENPHLRLGDEIVSVLKQSSIDSTVVSESS